MSINGAYGAHAALAVPGLKRNYDVDSIPTMTEALFNVPCLFPIFAADASMESTTSSATGDLTYTAQFLLVVSKASGVPGAWAVTPETVDLLDAYMEALRQNMDLDDNLDQDTTVSVTVRPRQIGSGDGAWYYVVEIQHTWLFLLG